MQFKLTHLLFQSGNTVYGCFYQYNAYTRNITNDISSFASYSAAESNLEYRNLTFTNNLVALEHATDVQIGNLIDNGAYKSQDVIFNLPVSDTIDYTQVLTDINTNLTSLNTNIQNKNNQSDIVDCLNNIFTQTFSNNVKNSIFKDSNANTDVEKANTNLCRLFRAIYIMLNNNDVGYSNLYANRSNSIFNDISRKIFDSSVANINNASFSQSDLCTRLYYLVQAFMKVASNNTSSIISNSLLKDISEKLANSNDLHTISQAIDLISTAIAQTPTTDTSNIEQGLNDIKTAVENKDNLLLIDGTQNFEFRKRGDEYDA